MNLLKPRKLKQLKRRKTASTTTKSSDVPNYIKLSFAILVVLVVLVGIYPSFFIHLIQTVSMGGR